MRSLLILIGLLILAVGCQPAEAPVEEPPAVATNENAEQVRTALREILTAMNRGDAEKVADYFTEDVVFLPPDAEQISGKQSVTASIRDFLEANRVSISFTTDELQASGEWAYDVGRFTQTIHPKVEGSPRVEMGKAILIFHLEGTQWRLQSYIWNFTR